MSVRLLALMMRLFSESVCRMTAYPTLATTPLAPNIQRGPCALTAGLNT